MADTIEATRLVSEQDIADYERDGAVCLRGLFDRHWLDHLRAATDRLLAGDMMSMLRKGDSGRFAGDVNMWAKDQAFQEFAFQSPSYEIARTLMRSSAVRLFTDQLFIKEPGTTTPTPWHHDQTYWPVVGDHVCSVWVTMDPVTRETSGLEYIQGSHRWGRRFDPEDFGEISLEMFRDSANEKMPDIETDRGSYTFLSWDMEPGDCLVHHALAVHGAGGNRSSTTTRRAISTRWLGDKAYFRPHGPMQPEVVGLAPGARMTSDLFPLVPPDGAVTSEDWTARAATGGPQNS